MLHISNLYHLIFAAICWFIIRAFVKRSAAATKFATTMRLLQIVPILFCVDLVAGFTLIEKLYGPHASAGWMSKSALIFPTLFVLSLWQMARARRADS